MITASVQILKMKKNGIVNPLITYQEAKRVGVPLAVACAVLQQETNGGHNEFGHDPTIFVGAGVVTEEKYLAYRKARIASGNTKMQGVGPMQLTYYGFQDEADALGGCWKPRFNIRVGLQILHTYYVHSKSWFKVFEQYNGSSAYATQVMQRVAKWEKILA